MDFSAVISSIGTVSTIAGALISERDALKAAAIKSELMEKVLTAQTQLMQLVAHTANQEGTIAELKRQVQELVDAKLERDRYELTKITPEATFMAFGLKSREELKERIDEPHHFLCQPCFSAEKKAVLHIGAYEAVCPLCKTVGSIARKPKRVIRSSTFG